jgi:hypothetical protein
MGPIAEYDPETQRWRPIPLWIPPPATPAHPCSWR